MWYYWRVAAIILDEISHQCRPSCPGLTLIPAWISKHSHYKVWDEIIYPFPNFNRATVEVWEWISNFIPHFIGHVITYSCWDYSWSILVNGAAGRYYKQMHQIWKWGAPRCTRIPLFKFVQPSLIRFAELMVLLHFYVPTFTSLNICHRWIFINYIRKYN